MDPPPLVYDPNRDLYYEPLEASVEDLPYVERLFSNVQSEDNRWGTRDLLVIVQVGNYLLPPCRATVSLNACGDDDEDNGETTRGQHFPPRPIETAEDSQPPEISPEWLLVWYCDTVPVWWTVTATILVLDEALRSGSRDQEPRIRDLLAELRGLRDMLNHLEKSKSSLPFPLLPPFVGSDGTVNLRISQGYERNILGRRFMHTFFGASRVLRADEALHDNLARSLRSSVTLAAVTRMFISDEERGKLRDYARKICALADDALISDCLAQLHNEVEILSRLCFHGMGVTPSRSAYADVEGAVTSGGFGEIFKVESRLWGKLAYKREFKLRSEPDTKGLTEFHRVVGLGPHPNILPIFGYRNIEGEIVSVMPWAENGTLEDYLQKNPASDRRRLLHGVSSALAHVHDSEMVHGDIHMKNVLISIDGDALLCDFGLSKKVEEDGLGNVLGYSSMPEGVPVYIAPERHRGRPRSRESDVFAFGMLCHQTYSGTRPMAQCPNAMATIVALSRGERPSRSEVTRSDFSDEMWQLVQMCWAQNPEDRPTMETVERLLRDMHTPEELHAIAEEGVRVTLRVFGADDAALKRDSAIKQTTAQCVRSYMLLIELMGLKDFVTNIMGPNDFTPLTGLLDMDKRAIKTRFSSHDPGCMIS